MINLIVSATALKIIGANLTQKVEQFQHRGLHPMTYTKKHWSIIYCHILQKTFFLKAIIDILTLKCWQIHNQTPVSKWAYFGITPKWLMVQLKCNVASAREQLAGGPQARAMLHARTLCRASREYLLACMQVPRILHMSTVRVCIYMDHASIRI